MAGYNPQDDGSDKKKLRPYNNADKQGYDAARKDRFEPSQQHTGWGEGLNFLTDAGRNLANFAGGPVGSSPVGGGYGDYVFGSNPTDGLNRKKGGLANGLKGLARPAQTEQQGAPSLMDIMSQLGSAFPGSEGGIVENPFISYDPLRNSARSNADASRAALSSVYSQMQNEIGDAGKAIDSRYSAAGEGIAQDRDETMAAVDGAYASSANQQADIARTLGIESAVAQAIDEGRDVSSRGADVQGRVAERAQGNLGYNTTVGTSEGTYNGRLGQAASQQGAYQQSRLQNDLLDRLSEIDMAEQQANANRFSAFEGSGPDTMDLFSMAQYIDESNRAGQQGSMEMQQKAYQDAMRDPSNVLAKLGQIAPQLKESGIPEEYAQLFIEQMLKGQLG